MPLSKLANAGFGPVNPGVPAGGFTNSGSTFTLNPLGSVDGVVALTLNANCTYTFPTAVSGQLFSFTLLAKQDGTGLRTQTWPASVSWRGIGTPVPDIAAKVHAYEFFTVDGGTTWYGVWLTPPTYYCRVTAAANQNIASGTDSVTLAFDTIGQEIPGPSGTQFNTTTHLYTCPIAGRYRVYGYIHYETATSADAFLKFIGTGASAEQRARQTSQFSSLEATTIFNVSAGATFGLGTYQVFANPFTTNAFAFQIEWVGP